MEPAVYILIAKAILDAGVSWFAFMKGDTEGGFLFLTFVLVDLASIGVLK